MNKLPKAKSTDIIVQEAGTELLIYDLIINKAFCLNKTSRIFFNACDGKTSFDELKTKHQFSDDLIFLALDELKKNNLIENNYQSKFTGVSRREVIKRFGLASMIALPIISSLVVPTAINAQSCLSAGTRFMVTTISQSEFVEENVSYLAAVIQAKCCNNNYQNFSYSCSNIVGSDCRGWATCL